MPLRRPGPDEQTIQTGCRKTLFPEFIRSDDGFEQVPGLDGPDVGEKQKDGLIVGRLGRAGRAVLLQDLFQEGDRAPLDKPLRAAFGVGLDVDEEALGRRKIVGARGSKGRRPIDAPSSSVGCQRLRRLPASPG